MVDSSGTHHSSNYEINPPHGSIDDSEVAASIREFEEYKVYEKDFIRSELFGQTLHFSDEGHSNQIEYLAPDGNAYLWYPGNRIILKGKWAVIEDRLIAFSFQEGTYNYLTKERMDRWDYRPLEFFVDTIQARREGDVFDLRKGLPRVLIKDEPIELSTFEP